MYYSPSQNTGVQWTPASPLTHPLSNSFRLISFIYWIFLPAHMSYNWRDFLNFSMLYLKWTLEIRNLMGSEVKSLCGWRPTVGLVRLDWAEPSVSKSEGFIKQQQTCMFCRCGPRKIPPTPTQATLHSWPCPCLECLVHHADESIINQLRPIHTMGHVLKKSTLLHSFL